jgi:hypothetical protein
MKAWFLRTWLVFLCATMAIAIGQTSRATEVLTRKGMRSRNVKPSLAGSRFVAALAMFVAGLGLMPSMVVAQHDYVIEPIAEMKVKQLSKGDLYWHVESFPTLEAAKAAAPLYRWNPDTISYEGLPSLTSFIPSFSVRHKRIGTA